MDPKPILLYLYQKEMFGHRNRHAHRGNTTWGWRQIRGVAATSQRRPKIAKNHEELREKQGTSSPTFFPQPSEETNPANLIFTSSLQNCETIPCLPVCGTLLCDYHAHIYLLIHKNLRIHTSSHNCIALYQKSEYLFPQRKESFQTESPSRAGIPSSFLDPCPWLMFTLHKGSTGLCESQYLPGWTSDNILLVGLSAW